MLPFARRLRRSQTEAEARLWHRLRNRQLGGWKFRRQVPVDRFVADFLCEDARLIVELDGGQHAERLAEDAERTAVLEACGYRVARYWNPEIFDNIDGVLEDILAHLEKR
ncbi:endonuclease domain-containing protein [Breoghania sp. L-A4]|uniref:endonuclease domain-containing protein n=1 Tax=Breoghania sp. L-A4 TaxID=2304600 RepID=UPI000E35EA4B|nr:endonuclease domain-containing protein [Breoghania sp. L-A4]AXS42082.1 DUF559 domain-containing protein [Breoghania sp. L-A4]